MAATRAIAIAITRLALFAFGVALVTSRVGLIAHELIGHGAVASAFGAEVDTWRLYWFAGGWIGYQKAGPWTWTGAVIVQLGGIAVELVLAGALVIAGRRARRAGRVALAVGLAGSALGLALHAGLYLCGGVLDGFGDGTLLHRLLGAARLAVALPLAAGLCALGFVAGRRVAAGVLAWLPVQGRAARLGALALALAAAGGAHAGLAVGETHARPNPTYQAIMTTERDRTIDRDVERWLAAERARGHVPDRPAVVAERRRLERERPARRLTPLVLTAVALATALGAGLARTRQTLELPARAVGWAVTLAVLATLTVGVLDAIAPK